MNTNTGARATLIAVALLTIALGGALHRRGNGPLPTAATRIPQPVGTAQVEGSAAFIPTPSARCTLYAAGASDLRVHTAAYRCVWGTVHRRRGPPVPARLFSPRHPFRCSSAHQQNLVPPRRSGERHASRRPDDGRSDTDLVCYVEFTGPISGSFVLSAPGVHVPTSYSKGVLVFDATPGNLLIRSVS